MPNPHDGSDCCVSFLKNITAVVSCIRVLDDIVSDHLGYRKVAVKWG
jgi:hypothetical protein